MSRTLNLVELLLNSGRHLRDIGRTAEALETLTRLADFRKLPLPVIEEIQALLADLYLQREEYSKARRHLTAALAIRPLKAEYHHLMGMAIEEDPQADLRRAEMYYAQAVEQEADNATYWIDYAAYLLRVGRSKEGLQALRRAYARGVHDAEIVGRVVELLRQEERFEEATAKLRAAFFRNHGDERFQQLWRQHQYQLIREEQREARGAKTGQKKGPVILPFAAAAPSGKYLELGEKTIRMDAAEPLRKPRSPLTMPFRRPPHG